ncbi:MAG: hypothetical protein JNM70_16225 [Anaerolineae bacterium]|nr:hypothetical protein [Anaerolineae bacterium]
MTRVAWLLNHTTLRDVELPVLRGLGLEVYTSKLLPEPLTHDFRNQSTDYGDDQHSTLPPAVLERLNRFRFYEEPITSEIAALLNDHFEVIICSQYPPLLRKIIHHYRGKIVLRAFGFLGNLSYGEYYARRENRDVLEGIHRAGDRFWFAPFYRSVAAHESDIFAERAIMLPIGLPERILRLQGTWKGDNPRTLFICPSIRTDPYYHGPQYATFKASLGSIPHVIVGRQEVPVDDPSVVGFVTNERYQGYLQTMRVLFYPGQEPRHIQYHPIEAALIGMPVVYLRGGLVHELAGGGTPVGSAGSYAEAKEQIERIMVGDADFITQVCRSQQTIPRTFMPDYVRGEWERLFIPAVLDMALIHTPANSSWPTNSVGTPSSSLTIKLRRFPLTRKALNLFSDLWWLSSRYVRAAVKQRRLRPNRTGIGLVFRHSRLGRWLP